MTPAQNAMSEQGTDEPHNAKAEPWLSVDTLLVGGSLAIGIVLLAVALALKHLTPALH